MWFFAPPGTDSITAYICHSEGKKHWGDAYHIVHRPDVLHLYKTLIREIESRGEFVDLCFQAFLRFFLRELRQGQLYHGRSGSTPDIQEDVSSPIAEAKKYIKAHLNQSLTAESVAGQVYMSRNNFLRHFSRETEQTFHEYITKQRMEKAGDLLREGRWSINFICRFTGLRPTQLRAQFKKYFGVNPSEFREKPFDLKTKVRKR